MNPKLKTSRLFVGAFLLIAGLFLPAGSAIRLRAATITVTSTLDENDGSCDDGDCSLRDAVGTAVPGSTISIPSGSYLLTLGQLVVTKDLELVGDSPAPILDGNASGRVLLLDGHFTLTLQNLIVTNGSSDNGGGIYVDSGRLAVINSEIRQNSATMNGGGVYLGDGGTLSLSTGAIAQNDATLNGGGVYNMDGMITQNGGTIEYNSSGTGGGVFVNLVQATYTLTNGLVQHNTSTALEKGGGGVYVAQGTVTVNGGQISDNSGVRGGGIEAANGKIVLNDGLIQQNQAHYGGGVYLSFPGALLTQNGGVISYNASSATDFGGGGVYGFQGSMVMTGGTISHNTAVTDGAGVNIRFGDLTISGGEIVHNTADRYGGGIFVEEATLTITNLQLGENAADDGGGLYLAELATLDLAQTAVYSNTATTNGGGLLLVGSSELTNATVSRNAAQGDGGGFWLQTGGATLNNVTVAENTAVNGGGLYTSGAAATLHNSLLAGNSATTGPNCGGTAVTSAGYNLIQDATDCSLTGDLTGNILSQDPLLEPLTLYNGPSYLHPLNVASPAIDAGDPAVCPTSDQHGRPRPLDGTMNGTAVCDIGAFEFGIPVRVSDVSVTEGDSGSVQAEFAVTLDFAAPVTVTVEFATTAQTALEEVDYAAVADTLSFDPGETTKTVSVPVLGDLLDEPDETFIVTLSNPVMAFLADGEGVGTIVDNDPLPALSIGDMSVTEGDDGTLQADFTVTLGATSGKTVQVHYATVDGSALDGVDYTAVSGTLNFTPGQTSHTIPVTILNDIWFEETKTFSMMLDSPVNATLDVSEGTGTILDNDPRRVFLPVVVSQ
ncbi:MAG: CSLREA domain-containing protein [Ardenticatenaceae bacterium]|nr:CSLREA domain-containing protein [Ardenticatenaceae bacterium]